MFITFEGCEGCGKSTQMRKLGETLSAKGYSIVQTREPGGTPIGEEIRKILLSGKNQEITPWTELLLYIADRTQHVHQVIRPALKENKIVLCDRFQDSTQIYQGVARGLDSKILKTLFEIATGGLKPDLTLLLDCPVELGLSRSRARLKKHNSTEDRFEKEDIHFHEKVRKGFLDLAKKEPHRIKIFDTTQDQEVVHGLIFKEVEKKIQKL